MGTDIITKERQFLKAYDDFSDAIFKHCYFRLPNRELALDLTQETFTRTWSEVANGKEIENFRAFLYRVANNLIIDFYRKKKEDSLDTLMEEGMDTADDNGENIEESVLVGQIQEVIQSLARPYRDILVMRYIDDLSPKEIASITGQTENTVSVRIHRGLKKVKQIIDHD